MSVARTRTPSAVGHALWTGALAGFVVGAADTLVSFPSLGQFLPGVLGRLACALFAAALHGFWFGLAGALAGAAGVVLMRHTAFGPLVARIPRTLTSTALAVAAVPCFGGALAGGFLIGYRTILTAQHKGLITAVTVAATFVMLVLAIPATFALGRVVELVLRRLPRRDLLTRPLAPPLAALALVAVAAAVPAFLFRNLLAQVNLRPLLALVAWVVTCGLLKGVTARVRLRPVFVVVGLVLALVLGRSDAIRKGAAAYTGLSTPLMSFTRAIFDVDRDGYSSVLGGGDCNDFNRSIHPGAVDKPGDGVDSNCSGSDAFPGAAAERSVDDVAFVAPPAALADANVILITIDTLRADHLGAYGYSRATSPALDALAAKGTLFTNAWAHAPSTRYSMPAIITGRHPSQVLWDPRARTPSSWWPGLQPENHTIAEYLKDRGLHTGAILNYEYFDARRRMNQGFDEYDNSNAVLHASKTGDPASTQGSSSRQQADAAIRFLDAHKDERFYLWVHFYDPHADYERHPESQAFGDDPVALYDGEIRFTDDQIARVLSRLRELGLDGKTVIMVTGDHGEGFGEHGQNHHGYHLYAAQTKVPLIVYAPGLPARKVTMPVAHVDILPTLTNLVGGAAEATMMGRSLVGLMAGSEADHDRDVFQEVSFEGPTERRGLVTRDWHLLYNMVPDGTFELYDLRKDPQETRDVWGSDEVGNGMRDRLVAWVEGSQVPPEAAASLGDALPKTRPSPAVAVEADFGDASIKFLGIDIKKTEVRRGDNLDITWYWQSLKPLKGGFKPFVHFEAEGGGRFLGDHDTVNGKLPMSKWQPGQFIADRQVLTVPADVPPGEYVIYLGVFERSRRLPVANAGAADAGQSRVRVGTVRVAP